MMHISGQLPNVNCRSDPFRSLGRAGFTFPNHNRMAAEFPENGLMPFTRLGSPLDPPLQGSVGWRVE
jgi:hypothetical protein